MKTFKEIVEAELQELSKKTLGSYIKKASQNRVSIEAKAADLEKAQDNIDRTARSTSGKTKSDLQNISGAIHKDKRDLHDKSIRRALGISKATDRLVKEEQISEESLKDYGDAHIYDKKGQKHEDLAKKATSDHERYMHFHHAALNYGHRDHEIAEHVAHKDPGHPSAYQHMKSSANWYAKSREHLSRSVEAHHHESQKRFSDNMHSL